MCGHFVFSSREWMIFCVYFGPHAYDRPPLGACTDTSDSALMLGEEPDMCGSCFSCLCNSSALLCLSLRMVLPSAVLEGPLGFHYILCVVAPLCLLENSSICPFRKSTTHPCLSVALRKHQRPLPLSISVYLCPCQQGPVVDIKCLL